jgi:hypothetical protein
MRSLVHTIGSRSLIFCGCKLRSSLSALVLFLLPHTRIVFLLYTTLQYLVLQYYNYM